MSVPLGDPSLFHDDIAQGTDEWLRLRHGKITGSRMKNVIAWKVPKPTKKNPEPMPEEMAERIMYRKELVAERLIGDLGQKRVFVTDAMQWGSMNEDVARTNYTLYTGRKVRQTGIIDHPKLKVAYSPDGLVGDDGMIEIKCLEPWNHLYEIVRRNQMPDQFKAQVQMGMWIANRQWCDFIGYDSRQPVGLDLFAVRVDRDDDYIAYLEQEAEQFLGEINKEVSYFLKFLPLCERLCRNCGLIFNDKLSICPGCYANNSVVQKELEKAEMNLRVEVVKDAK